MNKSSLLKRFGKNVKIERIKKDLTQEQFAEILDVNPNYVACIECGRQNMSLGKILELARAEAIDFVKNNIDDYPLLKEAKGLNFDGDLFGAG